jgi:xylulokinase
MPDALLLGVDLGTSAMKTAIFDLDGRCVAETTQQIPLETPGPGLCEVDPRAYWQALVGCCSELRSGGHPLAQVRALAVAANAETLLFLDDEFEPVRPGMVWSDVRSEREAADLGAHFGLDDLARRSGQPQVIPMWPATKILWLRRNEPENARLVRWWLQPLDYLLARLTGRVVSDASEYSSSLLLDIGERAWWEEILQELELAPRSLPELLPAGTALGEPREEARADLGLAPEIVIVLGGFDQACTALGAGNCVPGIVSESTGTSLAVTATVSAPPASSKTVPCHVHVVPDAYFLCAHNPSAGSILSWFQREFTPGLSFADLDQLARAVPAGSEGLLVLPYFAGSATPFFDPAARGVFFGLTERHGRGHLARAILEGVAFALADLVDAERALGVQVHELRSVGGGARSAIWSQIKADVIGAPVHTTEAPEHAGALGAAILAGVGSGLLSSVEAGVETMVRLALQYEPDARQVDRYGHARELHRELYPRLEELFASARGEV